jgi:hypothetical protein
MAAIAIYEYPGALTEIMKQFYTPQEPQMSPEEEAMIQQQMAQQQMAQGPPSISGALGA